MKFITPTDAVAMVWGTSIYSCICLATDIYMYIIPLEQFEQFQKKHAIRYIKL